MLSYAFQRTKILANRNVTVFVSDPSSPGEGELKIIHWLGAHLGTMNCSVTDSIAICGSDADIILQAVVLLNASDVLVLQTGQGQHSYLCNISNLVDGFMNAVRRINSTSQLDYQYYYQQQLNKNNNTDERVLFRRANRFVAGNKTLPLDWDFNCIQHSFRLDSLILLLLQGNDYLPKMRGISMSRIWRSYALAMRKLRKNDRYLVSSDRRAYNFKALWLLVMEFRAAGDARMPMPLQIPCSVSAFHSAVNRLFQLSARDVDFCLYQEVTKLASDGSVDSFMWGANFTLNGRSYSVDAKYFAKKTAKAALAEVILLDIDPTGYSQLMKRKETMAKKLEEMRSRSLEDRAAFNSQIKSTCNGSEQLLELTKCPGRGEICDSDSAAAAAAALDSDEDAEEKNDDTDFIYSDDAEINYCDERVYLDYLCDSDVVTYLRGILWVRLDIFSWERVISQLN